MKGGSQATTETHVQSNVYNPSQNLTGFPTQESQYSNSQPEKRSRRSRQSKRILKSNKGRSLRRSSRSRSNSSRIRLKKLGSSKK